MSVMSIEVFKSELVQMLDKIYKDRPDFIKKVDIEECYSYYGYFIPDRSNSFKIKLDSCNGSELKIIVNGKKYTVFKIGKEYFFEDKFGNDTKILSLEDFKKIKQRLVDEWLVHMDKAIEL